MLFERLTRSPRGSRLCLMMSLLLGLVALTGCATTPQSLTVTVPESLKSCPRTERPEAAGLTVGKLAAYSVQQAADLEVCDARRAAAISIIDAINKANAPKKPWWRF